MFACGCIDLLDLVGDLLRGCGVVLDRFAVVGDVCLR